MIFGCYRCRRPHNGRVVRLPSDARTRSRVGSEDLLRNETGSSQPKRKKPGRFDQASSLLQMNLRALLADRDSFA